MWRLLARVGVGVLVLAAGLGFAVSSGAAAQTVADVEVRDRLIADQEALLNVYRCMFGVDTQVVPGGCSNGAPGSPAQKPGQFSGTPTAQDVAVRDQLIADQEALLNVYRCQFDIDTELVPGGCQNGAVQPTPDTTPENVGPVLPNEEPWSQYLRIGEFMTACGFWEGTYGRCHNHPKDTNEAARLLGELYSCEWDLQAGGCRGFGGARMQQLDNELFCQNGWVFWIDFEDENHQGYCSHPDHL